jgi:ABC-type glutathione transport system ATPase component
MYVRLGFAIAAHLEPEILLLDEVLAVGDRAFQRKCFDRVRALQREGRTIIFISHDLGAVEALCDRVLLMQRGEVIADGLPDEVIEQYKALTTKETTPPSPSIGPVREWRDVDAQGDRVVQLRRVRVCGEEPPSRGGHSTPRLNGSRTTFEGGHVLVPACTVQRWRPPFVVLDLEPGVGERSRPTVTSTA